MIAILVIVMMIPTRKKTKNRRTRIPARKTRRCRRKAKRMTRKKRRKSRSQRKIKIRRMRVRRRPKTKRTIRMKKMAVPTVKKRMRSHRAKRKSPRKMIPKRKIPKTRKRKSRKRRTTAMTKATTRRRIAKREKKVEAAREKARNIRKTSPQSTKTMHPTPTRSQSQRKAKTEIEAAIGREAVIETRIQNGRNQHPGRDLRKIETSLDTDQNPGRNRGPSLGKVETGPDQVRERIAKMISGEEAHLAQDPEIVGAGDLRGRIRASLSRD